MGTEKFRLRIYHFLASVNIHRKNRRKDFPNPIRKIFVSMAINNQLWGNFLTDAIFILTDKKKRHIMAL